MEKCVSVLKPLHWTSVNSKSGRFTAGTWPCFKAKSADLGTDDSYSRSGLSSPLSALLGRDYVRQRLRQQMRRTAVCEAGRRESGHGFVRPVCTLSWVQGLRWPVQRLPAALLPCKRAQVGVHTWQMCARARDVFSLRKEWLNKRSCWPAAETARKRDCLVLQDRISKYRERRGKRCCAVSAEEGLDLLGSPNHCGKDRDLVRRPDFQANARAQHWC